MTGVQTCALPIYRDVDFENLMRITQRQIAAGERTGLSSFATLSRPLTPEIQLSVAQTWAEETKRLTAEDRRLVNFAFERRSRDRIRVAYVSSDFYNHATSHLIQGLFGRHDRSGFEIYAVSHGKNDGSSYRKRIEADSDRLDRKSTRLNSSHRSLSRMPSSA